MENLRFLICFDFPYASCQYRQNYAKLPFSLHSIGKLSPFVSSSQSVAEKEQVGRGRAGRPTSSRGSGLCAEPWAPTPTPPESLAPGCSEPCLLAALPRVAEGGRGESPEPPGSLLLPLVLNGKKLCHAQQARTQLRR